MADREAETMDKVAIMLEKKAEGRPLPPEDYDTMAKFIDRVEKRVEKKRREEDREEQRRYEEALATVPELTFEINILDVDLKEHLLVILQEGGLETLGDLVLQMRLDPDKILAMNGIGPKAFQEISDLTDGLRAMPEPVIPEQIEPVQAEKVQEVPEAVEELEAQEEIEEQEEVEVSPAEEKPQEVEVKEEVKEEVEEEFDKLFSYDARKYGYYKSEKPVGETIVDDSSKTSKKKKKKKPRPAFDDSEDWGDWTK